MRRALPRYLRLCGGAALVALTLWLVDPVAVFDRLVHLQLGWALLGLVLSVPLHLVLALRWVHIARSIEAPLGYLFALRCYYLAGFVNQALPTGLAGAALRALRHSKQLRASGSMVGLGAAATAVILGRISGLGALCFFGLVGALALGFEHPIAGLVGGASVTAMLVAGYTAFWLARKHAGFGKSFVRNASAALWGTHFWQPALLSSAVVILLSATFYCAARAAGVDLSFPRTLLIAPLVLGSMAIPLALAGGWGLREAAAAALFAALGMEAATGVAVSVAFGVITLVASAPGLLVWLRPEDGAQTPGDGTEPART